MPSSQTANYPDIADFTKNLRLMLISRFHTLVLCNLN